MKMKNIISVLTLLFLVSCGNKKNVPDVSNIQIELSTQRFEQDFFKLDTLNIETSLNNINKKYPSFLPDYLYNILGLTPPQNSIEKQLKLFLKYMGII